MPSPFDALRRLSWRFATIAFRPSAESLEVSKFRKLDGARTGKERYSEADRSNARSIAGILRALDGANPTLLAELTRVCAKHRRRDQTERDIQARGELVDLLKHWDSSADRADQTSMTRRAIDLARDGLGKLRNDPDWFEELTPAVVERARARLAQQVHSEAAQRDKGEALARDLLREMGIDPKAVDQMFDYRRKR